MSFQVNGFALVIRRQKVFLHNGLMEYGSVSGHGAYLGPDFTADYLHRSAQMVRDSYGGGPGGAAAQTGEDFRTNTYDEDSGTVALTDPQVEAFERLRAGDHSLDDVRALGELLERHVRFEERELFPRIESDLEAPSIAALGARLQAE